MTMIRPAFPRYMSGPATGIRRRAGRAARLLPAAAIAVALSACQTTGPGAATPQARLLWQSAQCAEPDADARWVDDGDALERVVEEAARNQLGGDTPEVPAADFEDERVLLFALGEKPTAGHGIELADSDLDIEGGRARLALEIIRPAEDSAQAQVLTLPCALIALERGSWSTLEIVDQQGSRRARLDAD